MKCKSLKCILICITNNSKPSRKLASQKLSLCLGLFGFKSLHVFLILVRWEEGTYCLLSSLFGHKNGIDNLEYEIKPYQICLTAAKTLNNIKML